MDIQEYISGGVIESYVLGLTSADETQEVETLAAQHPEVKQAIIALEVALEKQALANGVPPPPSLKQQVMDALAKERMLPSFTNPDTARLSAEQAKLVLLTAAPKSIKWLRGAIAASILLLLGSAILNFYLYSQYKKYSKDYTNLLAEKNTVLAKNEALQASYDMMKDTSILKVQMKAEPLSRAGSMATVLWDTKSKDVYLMVNSLPKQAADKQYQLWAMVDGKPVDAGMIDLSKDGGLIKMSNIPKAEAFAITLEKKGGAPAPDMTQLYVLGNV